MLGTWVVGLGPPFKPHAVFLPGIWVRRLSWLLLLGLVPRRVDIAKSHRPVDVFADELLASE
jgi:hypothetical protein